MYSSGWEESDGAREKSEVIQECGFCCEKENSRVDGG